MVNLTRIYTRTGDAGATRLSDMSETRKTDVRVDAYGQVDEANSVLGIALAAGLPDAVAAVLAEVQNELFDVGPIWPTPSSPSPPGRRCGSPSRASTGWRRGATSSATRCPTWCRSSCPAAASQPPTCTSRGRSSAGPSAPAGPRPRPTGSVSRPRTPRRHQPAGPDLPEPPVRPAVHPHAGRQRRRGRGVVGAGQGPRAGRRPRRAAARPDR